MAATYIIPPTFDGQVFGFCGADHDGARIAAGVTFALDGTPHYHTSAWLDNTVYTWTGLMDSAVYAALETKRDAGTSGSLVTTLGTCTAVIIEMSGSTRGGDPPNASASHMKDVTITFQKRSAWS